jgi:hypothetical protein
MRSNPDWADTEQEETTGIYNIKQKGKMFS